MEFRVPLTFLEPLVLAGITAMAVGEMVAVLPVPPHIQRRVASVPWSLVTWVVAGLLGSGGSSRVSMLMTDSCWDSTTSDISASVLRTLGPAVVSSWRRPACRPSGIISIRDWPCWRLLWGLWPDPKLFMLIQAVCLALSAPIILCDCPTIGSDEAEAAMWATAYLLYPPLSQLNLSYSYGWHPVSLALPSAAADAPVSAEGPADRRARGRPAGLQFS